MADIQLTELVTHPILQALEHQLISKVPLPYPAFYLSVRIDSSALKDRLQTGDTELSNTDLASRSFTSARHRSSRPACVSSEVCA